MRHLHERRGDCRWIASIAEGSARFLRSISIITSTITSFPGVPWYNLRQVHKELQPVYAAARPFVERSYTRYALKALFRGPFHEIRDTHIRCMRRRIQQEKVEYGAHGDREKIDRNWDGMVSIRN
jgi:hypothetical protein